jgi:hypothetical protein
VETTSLLKKEEMTPRLGGSTENIIEDICFQELKNSPSWTDAFLFRKWIEIFDGQRFPIVVNMGNGPDC